MNKFKILVFPCGSEIGLEIYRSLNYSSHIELYGASSVEDHGRFIYENYIGGVPFIDDDSIIPFLSELVSTHQFDAIYPSMDKVIWKLKINERNLGCKVIASHAETTEICLSKKRTYSIFSNVISVPKLYDSNVIPDTFPVFIKPDIGYGSRNTFKLNNIREYYHFISTVNCSDYVITEYLSGKEYTIDCFTDRLGTLRFVGPRERLRISNGISVHTKPVKENYSEYESLAYAINRTIKLQGAWFFQVKKKSDGTLALLEIASRLGGSSGLYRCLGVNFSLLSIFDSFNIDVEIFINDVQIEMDRALGSRYKLRLDFSKVYVDFDDCLIINKEINIKLIEFLYKCINKGKRIILITKHNNNLEASLKMYKLYELFDEIVQVDKTEDKYKYITGKDSILIDDSFSERKEVKRNCNISVFSPDMIEVFF
jgi:hypothetical protein